MRDKESDMTGEMKTLDFPFELKQADDEGTFEGHGSVFDVLDSDREIVVRGAFAKTLVEREGRIKLLWQHQSWEPIGVPLELKEDDRGLFLRGQLAIKATQPRDVHELMKLGVVDGLSIGFRTIKAETDDDTRVRKLTEIELWEISLVTFPANPQATVASVKDRAFALTLAGTAGGIETERDFERFLRDAGFSQRRAKAIVASGFKTANRDGSARELLTALKGATETFRGADR